jgi:hypothetical protein
MLNAYMIDGCLAAEPVGERSAAAGGGIVQEVLEHLGVFPAEPAGLLLRAGSREDFGGHAHAL